MIVSWYVCLFIIYSLFGWIYETIYCTLKRGRWENRGFLYGPACPIYGTGAVAISSIMHAGLDRGLSLLPWQIFAVSVIGSAVLEYLTAWALEELFHAIWWDYSSLPFNLHGRISLFTSLGFGGAGLLVAYVIAPFTESSLSGLDPLLIELLSLLFISVFMADLTLTVTALLHFDRVVIRANDAFNRNMASIVDSTAQRSAHIKQGLLTRQDMINERLHSMSGFLKSPIRRVKAFRGSEREKARIHLLSRIKKVN